jgi:mono/diheme cytochrome c family protein
MPRNNGSCSSGSATGVLGQAQSASEKIEFFEARVRPSMVNNCYACHTDNKLGGLRVDSRVALLEGGKSGPAIVPGRPDESLLIKAAPSGGSEPEDAHGRDEAQGQRDRGSAVLDSGDGGFWPTENAKPAPQTTAAKTSFTIRPEQRKFWSFQPIQKSPVPKVKNTAWAKSPIDQFILAKLEEKSLQPAQTADKRVLIRRAYFDLDWAASFTRAGGGFFGGPVSRCVPQSCRPLAGHAQYGERWARHWLDVARYADGAGRPDTRPVFLGYGMARDGYSNTWRYRDWVIQALNSDMPYDQFVKAQIAADLMPEQERSKHLPALGYFGIGPWFTGDDVVFVEARANERDDKIDALTKGFLGLTVTCARCHNHKYDPISQKDYYALGGISPTPDSGNTTWRPEKEVEAYQAQRKKVKAAENALERIRAGFGSTGSGNAR